jgi:hypothetical protein
MDIMPSLRRKKDQQARDKKMNQRVANKTRKSDDADA